MGDRHILIAQCSIDALHTCVWTSHWAYYHPSLQMSKLRLRTGNIISEDREVVWASAGWGLNLPSHLATSLGMCLGTWPRVSLDLQLKHVEIGREQAYEASGAHGVRQTDVSQAPPSRLEGEESLGPTTPSGCCCSSCFSDSAFCTSTCAIPPPCLLPAAGS